MNDKFYREREEYKERVKAGNDIVEIIGEVVELKKEGKIYRGLCPFHEEKTPSFTVYPESQTFKCFGACGESGDVIKFIELYQKLTFNDALEYLAKRAGIDPPKKKNFTYQEKIEEEDKNYFTMEIKLEEIDKDLKRKAKEENWEKRLEKNGSQAVMQEMRDWNFKKLIPYIRQLDSFHQDHIKDWLRENWGIKAENFRKELRRMANGYVENLEAKRNKAKRIETKTLIPDLIYLVRDQGKVKYLLKNGDKLKVQENYIFNDIVYHPKQNLPIKMPGIEILEEKTPDWKELFDEVHTFIQSYVELPEEFDYLILTLWIFHTYLIEKFDVTPLIYFYGVKETGKTRSGEILGELAFRCERLTSPTEATLFRSADYFKTSLIVDEIKLWGENGNQEVARLIRSRYKRGLMVSRIDLSKKGENQVEYFDVFAPLVLCTMETVPPEIESRCIIFRMQKNEKIEIENRIDREWARKIRRKLVLFRSEFLGKKLPNCKRVARRRLNEIMMPLYKILMLIRPDLEMNFKIIIEDMQKKKATEEFDSLEAELIEEVSNFWNLGRKDFLTGEMSDVINESRKLKDQLSDRLVSMRLKRLGFEKARLEGGKRGYKIGERLLGKLRKRYGIINEGQEELKLGKEELKLGKEND